MRSGGEVYKKPGKRVETCEELKLNNLNIDGKFCKGIVGPIFQCFILIIVPL